MLGGASRYYHRKDKKMAKKKADLIEEAKALGLEVSEKMTIAEINEAIKGAKAAEIAEEIVEAVETAEVLEEIVEEIAEEKFAKSGFVITGIKNLLPNMMIQKVVVLKRKPKLTGQSILNI